MLDIIKGVLILYNRPTGQAAGGFAESEAGVLEEVAAVAKACAKLHVPVRSVGVDNLQHIPDALACAGENVVFNLVEGFPENPEQANWIPALCTAMGKACTGNSTAGLLLSLDKWKSKAVLRAADIPCPRAIRVSPNHLIHEADLFPGPYIVKPVGTDASEGIDRDSVIPTAGEALQQRVRHLHQTLGKPVLIEQYIEGRELNVSVLWRHDEAQVLPLAEIDFSAFTPDRPRIVGYEAKWLEDSFEYRHTPRIIPAPLPVLVESRVRELAVASCRALGCLDYCRVDFRLDAELSPYVLEVNANPDISPDAGFAAALAARDIGYHEFIRLCLYNALEHLPRLKSPIAPPPPVSVGDITIRRSQSGDRETVLSALTRTDLFRPNELTIACEVLDEAHATGPQGHYQSWVACQNDEAMGWICCGPTPCTVGTWDIYWIGVAPEHQGRGLGRMLMEHAEHHIETHGGHRVVIETSGRSDYHNTQAFYRELGYTLEAEVIDFYDHGDPKQIWIRSVAPSSSV